MSQYFRIHPDNPQARLISQAAEIIKKGGVAIYPTDSSYAIGCHMGDKSALDKVIRIRRLDEKHHFTLLCRDLSELGTYAQVGNSDFRTLKTYTPGAYTFILNATKEVPRRLMHAKRKTIGIRVPNHTVCQSLLEAVGEPMMTATLQLPGDEYPLTDPEDIRVLLEHQVDLIIDGGYGDMEETSVISLLDGAVEVLREGKGDCSGF